MIYTPNKTHIHTHTHAFASVIVVVATLWFAAFCFFFVSASSSAMTTKTQCVFMMNHFIQGLLSPREPKWHTKYRIRAARFIKRFMAFCTHRAHQYVNRAAPPTVATQIVTLRSVAGVVHRIFGGQTEDTHDLHHNGRQTHLTKKNTI